MPVATLYPDADNYVNYNVPNTVCPPSGSGLPYHLQAGVDLWDSGAGYHGLCRSWMRFALNSIPDGSTILVADLHMNAKYVRGDYLMVPVQLKQSLNLSWNENTITWNTQPTDLGVVIGTASMDSNLGAQEFTIAVDKPTVAAALPANGITFVLECEDGPMSGIDMPSVTMQDFNENSPVPVTVFPYLVLVYLAPAASNTIIVNSIGF